MATPAPDALSPAAIAAANPNPLSTPVPSTSSPFVDAVVGGGNRRSGLSSWVSNLPVIRSLPSLDLPNPGKYEDYNRESRDITSGYDFFDGAKIDITRSLSEQFGVTHSFALGGSDNRGGGSYGFSTNVMSANKKNIIAGRFEGEGKVMARLISHALPNTTLSAQALITQQDNPQAQPSGITAEVEYRGASWVSSLKLERFSVLEASFMQSISRHAALGFSLVHIPYQGLSGFSWAARFIGSPIVKENIPVEPGQPQIKVPRWVATAALSPFTPFTAAFTWNTKTPVTFATDFSVVPKMEEPEHISMTSVWSAGAIWEHRTSRIKARVDSNAHIGAVVEEQLNQIMLMTFSGDLDHYNQKYRFGLGVTFQL
eukprot:TRINITY_DN1482_c0_g1_i1.p1 TRINITY_DN1482_c0_g1~~TRINITY_DN1482_c0_g1_i1.p1  ORF type:complete len:371 (-),score=90.86 TRINITY_DN1482_c0_g1_i1:8-1120(-)